MKFRKKTEPTPIPEVDNALKVSQHALKRILLRDRAVKKVVSDIVTIHERNHFAEHIQALIAKEGPK